MAARGPGLMTGSGFPQRFADLDGSMIDVYQAMTQVTDEAEDTLHTTAQMHSLLDARSTTRSARRATTASSTRSCTRTSATTRELNDMVSEAQDRGVPIVSSDADAQLARRPQRLVVRQHRLQRQPADLLDLVTNDKARGLQAMLPASSATGPLVKLHARRPAGVVDQAHRQGRRLRRLQGHRRRLHGRLRDRHRGARDHAGHRHAGREGHATVTWTHRRAVDARASSTAARRRSAPRRARRRWSATTASSSADLTPGTTYSVPRLLGRRRRQQPPSRRRHDLHDGRPARWSTAAPPTSPPARRATRYAGGIARRRRRRGAAQADRRRGVRQRRPPGRLDVEQLAARRQPRREPRRPRTSTAPRAFTNDFTTPTRTLEFSATFRPVNNQGVGFSRDFSDYPFAVFTTG